MATSKKPSKIVEEVKTVDLTTHALCKVDEKTNLAYIDIPFIPRPVGGEYDDEEDAKIRIPKMKLLGPNSAELKKATRVQDAEEGMYFNTLTRELFEELEIVPLFKFRERYYMKPAGSSNMVCTSRDGLGKVGICLSGRYRDYGIPSGFTKEDGIDIQIGICKTCPHSKREYGEQAVCQDVLHLVCVNRQLLREPQGLIAMLESSDPIVASKILQNIFTLPFKSTSASKVDIILQTAWVTGAYFSQSWLFTSMEGVSDKYTWQTYVINSGTPLDETELILAYSIQMFAQKLRKIIRITDIEQSPIREAPSESPVVDNVNVVDIK